MGLCNGTRLIILQLGIKIIEAIIITGSHKGEKIFIPRIVLTYQDKKMAIYFKKNTISY